MPWETTQRRTADAWHDAAVVLCTAGRVPPVCAQCRALSTQNSGAHSTTMSWLPGRRQEAEAQQQCAERLAGVIEWLDAQADAEGPFFLGKQARDLGFRS